MTSGGLLQTEDVIYEICVGEGCNESKFVVGSDGSGNIGNLTYCPDCYSKVSGKTSNATITCINEVTNATTTTCINVTPTLEASDKANNLLTKDYTKSSFDFDYRTAMFDHLVTIKANSEYYVTLQICDDKALSYKLVPNNWGRDEIKDADDSRIDEIASLKLQVQSLTAQILNQSSMPGLQPQQQNSNNAFAPPNKNSYH